MDAAETSVWNAGDQTYVAQVVIPGTFSGSRSIRDTLPQPEIYGASRGYWFVSWAPDDFGTEHPIGLGLVVEIRAESISEAEDKALRAGDRLSPIVALAAGSPARQTRLIRLAQVDDQGHPRRQWEYWYSTPLPMDAPVRIPPSDFQAKLERYASLNADVRQALSIACRWYGVSIGAMTPVDAYLSAWIGLEALGPALDARVHENSRAACTVCGTEPGLRRNRTMAGIDHLLARTVPALIRSIPASGLLELRNRIAHALAAPEALGQVEEAVPDLQIALARGALTLLSYKGEQEGLWGAALPGDFELQPDVRFEVGATSPLSAYEPWNDRWLPIDFEVHTSSHSDAQPDGSYRRMPVFRVSADLMSKKTEGVPRATMTPFTRRGIEVEPFFPVDESSTGIANPEPVPWRSPRLTQAWRLLLQEQEQAVPERDESVKWRKREPQ